MSDSHAATDGDKIYEDARALCWGVAGDALKPYNQFTYRERQIIDATAVWMGSRDCEIVRLRWIADQLVAEATAATNALACVARAQYQHTEVARLHTAIGLLSEELVGSATAQSAKRAVSTRRSAAP